MISLADRHYPVDIRRARAKLCWEPRHTLRGTLAEMIRRLKTDPVRWYEVNKLAIPEQLAVHA
jgi:hypothetical protein